MPAGRKLLFLIPSFANPRNFQILVELRGDGARVGAERQAILVSETSWLSVMLRLHERNNKNNPSYSFPYLSRIFPLFIEVNQGAVTSASGLSSSLVVGQNR